MAYDLAIFLMLMFSDFCKTKITSMFVISYFDCEAKVCQKTSSSKTISLKKLFCKNYRRIC